jgi:hypothetical protein
MTGDDEQILANAPPKQGKWPDCNQVDSDGGWSHRQPVIRALSDIQAIVDLRRENAELENEKTTLLKCHYNVCWELVELEKALSDSTLILGGKIQELEKENEWLFDFALGYTNSTFINESLQALKESK